MTTQEANDFLERLTRKDKELLLSRLIGSISYDSVNTQKVLDCCGNKRPSSCPYCNSHNIVSVGPKNDVLRMRCKYCSKYFSSTTGTAIHRVRKREKFLKYLICMEAQMSIRQAAKATKISLKTSFNWRHRILSSLEVLMPKRYEGITESDEMFFSYSDKGNKKLKRKPRKRAVKSESKIKNKVAVLVNTDRAGHKELKVLSTGVLKAKDVKAAFESKLNKENILCTDGSTCFIKFAKVNKIPHKRIITHKGRTLGNKRFHIQTVNNLHQQTRAFLQPFRGVATKYLQNYLYWFDSQYHLRKASERFDLWIQWITSSYKAYDRYIYNTT